jgi:hypothetical protein
LGRRLSELDPDQERYHQHLSDGEQECRGDPGGSLRGRRRREFEWDEVGIDGDGVPVGRANR